MCVMFFPMFSKCIELHPRRQLGAARALLGVPAGVGHVRRIYPRHPPLLPPLHGDAHLRADHDGPVERQGQRAPPGHRPAQPHQLCGQHLRRPLDLRRHRPRRLARLRPHRHVHDARARRGAARRRGEGPAPLGVARLHHPRPLRAPLARSEAGAVRGPLRRLPLHGRVVHDRSAGTDDG